MKWISVKERLPENTAEVLVYATDNFCQYTAYWDEKWGWRLFGGYGPIKHIVTHWMPLPDPPDDTEPDQKKLEGEENSA